MRRTLVLLLFLGVGCSRQTPWDFHTQALTSGSTVASLANSDAAIILYMSPQEVFTCGNHLNLWFEWARRTGGELHLVFSREATDVERTQLALMRIRDYHILARSPGGGALPGAREYLVDRGRIRYSMDVVPGQIGSYLLTQARDGRLAGMVH